MSTFLSSTSSEQHSDIKSSKNLLAVDMNSTAGFLYKGLYVAVLGFEGYFSNNIFMYPLLQKVTGFAIGSNRKRYCMEIVFIWPECIFVHGLVAVAWPCIFAATVRGEKLFFNN